MQAAVKLCPQARVKAFGMGADDFITKPYDHSEMFARMQAIVRRSKGYSQPSAPVRPASAQPGQPRSVGLRASRCT